MGLLELLGLRSRDVGRHLVVVTFEGPNRLRLNASRSGGARGRRGAAAHDRTVGWIEFSSDGSRLDQGLGPAAAKLKAADVQALMRDLPAAPACKSVLRELTEGRERTSKVLSFEKWGQFGLGQGTSEDGGPSE
jgi:hypothetical protein